MNTFLLVMAALFCAPIALILGVFAARIIIAVAVLCLMAVMAVAALAMALIASVLAAPVVACVWAVRWLQRKASSRSEVMP